MVKDICEHQAVPECLRPIHRVGARHCCMSFESYLLHNRLFQLQLQKHSNQEPRIVCMCSKMVISPQLRFERYLSNKFLFPVFDSLTFFFSFFLRKVQSWYSRGLWFWYKDLLQRKLCKVVRYFTPLSISGGNEWTSCLWTNCHFLSNSVCNWKKYRSLSGSLKPSSDSIVWH